MISTANTLSSTERSTNHWLVGGSLGLLILAMWLPFGPRSGMPYETTFAQWSENSSIWHGFFFVGDPLRPHTNTFYHLSYLLSVLLGITGSFVTYGIVYSLLWWARGFLTYLILQEFNPQSRLFNMTAGAIVLTHAADGALQWVGQMNQFGVIFWMLSAYYVGLRYVRSTSKAGGIACLVFAAFFLHMSLWSYEAQLPVLIILPLFLLALNRTSKIRRWGLCAVWYLVTAIYITQSLLRYTKQTDSSYQQGVLSKSGLDPMRLLGDLWFNISAGIKFWSWGDGLPTVADLAPGAGVQWGTAAVWLISVFAVLIVILAGWQVRKEGTAPDSLPSRRRLLHLAGYGAVLLAASFPVFLLLASARGLWRTQFIAGLGYGILSASIAALVASLASSPRWRSGVFLCLVSIPLCFGCHAAIKRGAYHYGIWERHRFAVAQILSVAPSIQPGSTIILTNVPKAASPFGDNMWYLVALQLAYPKTYLAGAYIHADGTPAPSFNLKIDGSDWIWNGIGWPPPEPRRFPFNQTVVIEFSPDGHPRVLTTIPVSLAVPSDLAKSYNPYKAISDRPPALKNGIRRYLLSGRIR